MIFYDQIKSQEMKIFLGSILTYICFQFFSVLHNDFELAMSSYSSLILYDLS